MNGDEGFGEFVAARSPGLLRVGWLLTGDYQLAEDLLQTALVRAWPHWHRVVAGGSPEAYVRRVMVRTYATWWRRRWRAEVPHGELPDRAAPDDDPAGVAELRAAVLRALAQLPPRQRAVVALRYYEDLPEDEVARILDCSPGTVKSQAAKARARLRTLLPAWTGEETTL